MASSLPYPPASCSAFCSTVNKYTVLTKIGRGTFGEVFKAQEKKADGRYVALKKLLTENEREGFPITALREITILQALNHENVVELIEVCWDMPPEGSTCRLSKFYLVFEFCEHDLAALLANHNVQFSLGEIKKVMQQLLNGLHHIHANKILHRDLKSSNILITKKGVLKLADFGLARAFSTGTNSYENKVVTLWYRPPELLLGERNYGTAIDMWGAGCIMAEMWTRSPILKGISEQHQLQLIIQLCGSITTDVWPTVRGLDLFNKIQLPENQARRVNERLRHYIKDKQAVDLVDKLLALDPGKRIEASAALDHDFFWTDPMPVDLSNMLSKHSMSMFEYFASRRMKGAQENQRQQQLKQEASPCYQERVY